MWVLTPSPMPIGSTSENSSFRRSGTCQAGEVVGVVDLGLLYKW